MKKGKEKRQRKKNIKKRDSERRKGKKRNKRVKTRCHLISQLRTDNLLFYQSANTSLKKNLFIIFNNTERFLQKKLQCNLLEDQIQEISRNKIILYDRNKIPLK